MTGSLQGMRVVVTGASGDLGSAIVTRFLAAGASVSAQVFRHRDVLEARVADAGVSSEALVVTTADLTDRQQLDGLFAGLGRRWGGLDVLVNSVGGATARPLTELSGEEWDETLRLNLTVPFLCLKAAVDLLTATRGSVVNVSSVAGLTGGVFGPHYASAKAGLIGLTRSAARELGALGIRVNAVAPGPVASAMTGRLDERTLETMMAATSLGRVVQPDEVADVVIWLAGRATALTGQTIVVDAGRHFL